MFAILALMSPPPLVAYYLSIEPDPVVLFVLAPFSFILCSFLAWSVVFSYNYFAKPFPPCCRGICTQRTDFGWDMPLIFGRNGWGVYYYRCKCGDYYVRRGRQFRELLTDGRERPYLIIHGVRSWRKENLFD